MDYKAELLNILKAESLKSKVKALISPQVFMNFTKFTNGSNTANNKLLIQEAVNQYKRAQHTNTKISRFSPPKVVKKNKVDNLDLLNKMAELVEPIKPRKIQRGYKTIDEFKNKISKANRTNFHEASVEASELLKDNLEETRKQMSVFKFESVLIVHFFKIIQSSEVKQVINADGNPDFDSSVKSTKAFQQSYIKVFDKAHEIACQADINKYIAMYVDTAQKKFDSILLQGSGWSLDNVAFHIAKIYKNKNLRGAKYIPTPEPINNKRNGLVNIQNDDNECFRWCLKFHQSESKLDKATRITALKKVVDKYNYKDINYPTTKADFITFENNNPTVQINVFEYDDEKEEPVKWIVSKSEGTDTINLLLIREKDNDHLCYIKDMSCLFRVNASSKNVRKWLCPRCCRGFTERQKITHKCGDEFTTSITYPTAADYMQMTTDKYKKQIKAPFICYCDFESFVVPTDDEKKIHKHTVNSYCIKLVCSFDARYNQLYFFRGEKAVERFIEKLLKIKDEVDLISKNLRAKHKLPKLTPEQEQDFQKQTKCYICSEKFDSPKVRDHCHLTGAYRGASCNTCNLNFHNMKLSKKTGKEYEVNADLICAFHNLRGYDGHFIIQEASKYTDNVRAISQSFEKFMTFSFLGLKFIDTFLFMSSSLDTLTESLKGKGKDTYTNFIYTQEHFKENTELMCRKGVYPYEFVNSHEVFEIKTLPPKKAFYSALKNEHITDEEYTQAEKVYTELECDDFGDYHDNYLVCDVLLLADIFENFRMSALEKYKLDPANYLTAPSLAWDAMLDMTKIKLGLIHNEETRLLFENNKRGGIVQAGSRRLVKANNKYMKNYDAKVEDSFIMYYDMNNQYGAAMRDYLPYELNGIKTDITLEYIMKHPANSKIGYFVECDIHLPIALHDKFKDYPLCPITRNVKTEELGEYQKDILQKNDAKHSNNSKKLILDFHDKTNYLCHYRYIQGIVKLGYEITKIHKVVEFKQSQWLKPYIDMNTKHRQAKGISKFLKDFYKLLNNAIYGKTNENVLGRTAIDLVKNEDLAIKRMSKENFKSGVLLDEMFFIESEANEVHYDRPSYIGNAILDLSKLYMFEFHHNYMKKKYGDNCELIYTDTDSFVYHIKTSDMYKDNFIDRDEYFDLSEVCIKEFHDETNAKVIGKFKDESNMIPIVEFCSLAPKSYSFITDADEVKKTCKGVSKSVLKKEISFDDFKNTLETGKRLSKVNTSIRSFKHQVYTFQATKICLSAFDDKIYRETSNLGYPYGHYMIHKH